MIYQNLCGLKNFDNFFNLKNGETIAELGAGDGSCSFAISLVYDSLKIYLEDFDTKTINSKTKNTINKKYRKVMTKRERKSKLKHTKNARQEIETKQTKTNHVE